MAAERRVLGSLDLLPEECQDDVAWALARLNERSRSQADILFELNDRLAVKGHGPISRSAFSRRSTRLKRRRDQIEERNAVYAGVAEMLTPEKVADADTVLGEFLKTLIDERADEAKSSKELNELSSAYRNIVVGQDVSARRRQKEEARAKATLVRAVDTVAKVKGMTAETAEAIKAQILGVRA